MKPWVSVGYLREQKVPAILAWCRRFDCHHKGRVVLDGFPEDLTLDRIKPRLRCTACGAFDATLQPDWPGPGVGAFSYTTRRSL